MTSAEGLRFGRRPPTGAPALRLAPLLTGVVPEHPDAVDNIAVGGWQVLGNNRYGDCVCVTWANERRLMTRLAGAERYPTLDDVLGLYRVFNPAFPQQDDGCVIQDVLDYLHKQGGPDGVRPVAYAKVDVDSPDELRAAIAVFRMLWLGVDVQYGNLDEFSRGVPWTWNPDGRPDGGHSIIGGAYRPGQLGMVTWGTEAELTDEFVDRALEEAWAVIWPEHLSSPAVRAGLDLDRLAVNYEALTGHPLVVPTPEPRPQPGPAPAPPTDAELDRALADAARDWVDNHRHSGEAADVARALRTWMGGKRLGAYSGE